MSGYELLKEFKTIAKKINDDLTGKTVELAIKDEIAKARALGSPVLEPSIVLEALRTSNQVKAYGIDNETLADLARYYLQYGIPKPPEKRKK